jgi:hypothetical protein
VNAVQPPSTPGANARGETFHGHQPPAPPEIEQNQSRDEQGAAYQIRKGESLQEISYTAKKSRSSGLESFESRRPPVRRQLPELHLFQEQEKAH